MCQGGGGVYRGKLVERSEDMKGQKMEMVSWASENLYSVRAVMQFVSFLLTCVHIQCVRVCV